MRLVYSAVDRGELVTGHVEGDPYEIIIGGRSFVRRKRDRKRVVTALDGTRRSQLERIEREWQVVTTKIAEGPDLDIWYEFLDSVANDEVFTWDRKSSTAATDIAPLGVILVSTTHTESRILRTNNYRFSLTLREA